MNEIEIRLAERRDLAQLTEIYNYYVVNTPVTFDVEPYAVERRETWFAQFGADGAVSAAGGRERGGRGWLRRDHAVSSEGSV